MNFSNPLLMTAESYSIQLWKLRPEAPQRSAAGFYRQAHSQTLRAFVARHPNTSPRWRWLLFHRAAAAGAFAVANLGPDASNLPGAAPWSETLETPNLEAQVAAEEQKTLKLYRQRHHPRHRHRREFAAPYGLGGLCCSQLHSSNT
jgi:hypothetical protein